MATRADEYRLKAQECAERARLAPDPQTKRQFEDMAGQWLNLAKQAEEGAEVLDCIHHGQLRHSGRVHRLTRIPDESRRVATYIARLPELLRQ